MSKKEDKVTLEDLYWATLSKNDIIRVLKDNCSKNMVLEKQLEIKDQRIAELEEQLKNCIRPKFPRQEHICSFAFGEIREYIVVAYVDNDTTLCENIEDNTLEWCDNNFLVRTFEEAHAKLEELKGG